jgi:hypothetical protein
MATATKKKRTRTPIEQAARKRADTVRRAAKDVLSGKKKRKVVATAPVSSPAEPRDPLSVNHDGPVTLYPKKEPKEGTAPGMSALDLPVSYSGVSIGKQTARMGITVARDELNVIAASETLCNRRLNGRVLLGDDEGALFEKSLEVKGVFDVKGFRCTSDVIGAGLTFQLNDVDVATLAKFSKGSGRLVVDEVLPIPGDANHDDEFEEE